MASGLARWSHARLNLDHGDEYGFEGDGERDIVDLIRF
jgi:hypothetical protein